MHESVSPLIERFILYFGEMGSRWGINRTVGQIYALLIVSKEPLNAEQISETLGFSRSNVSMGMKELESWNLVIKKHISGDRRDYFTTPEDVWEIFRRLVEERHKREVEPTLTLLRDLILEEPDSAEEEFAVQRMKALHGQIDMLTSWYKDMQRLETNQLIGLIKLGSKVSKLYDMKDKLKIVSGGKKKR